VDDDGGDDPGKTQIDARKLGSYVKSKKNIYTALACEGKLISQY
jgi:hypothetical protein